MAAALTFIALAMAALSGSFVASGSPQEPDETPLFKLVIKKGSGDGATQTMSANEAKFRNYPLVHTLASLLRFRPVLTEGLDELPDSKVDIDFTCYTIKPEITREIIAKAVCEIWGLTITREKRIVDTVVLAEVKPTAKLVPDESSESYVRSSVEQTEFKAALLGSLVYSLESGVKMPVVDETKHTKRYSFTWKRVPGLEGKALLEAFAKEFGFVFRIEKRPHEFTVIKKT